MGNQPSTESVIDPTTTMMPTTYEATTWTYRPLTDEEIADILELEMGNQPSTESVTDPTTTMMTTTSMPTTRTYPPLTEEKIADIKKSMSPIDKDGDGIITSEEVETFMIIHADNSTEYFSEAEILGMADRFDRNGNGTSYFHDFDCCRYVQETLLQDVVINEFNDYAEYKLRFSYYDLDGDGFLTFDEVNQFATDSTVEYNRWYRGNIFWKLHFGVHLGCTWNALRERIRESYGW